MKYRRFGRTGLKMPVISCGGMRFQQTWGQLNMLDLNAESQRNVEACVHRALDLGINHIETAFGYGSSETQLGLVLPRLPRDEIIVQTKTPAGSRDDAAFMGNFETSMERLQLDYVDLLALHGVNNQQDLNHVLNDGIIDAALELQRQGRIRYVGFSSHARCDTLLDAIATDAFDYVNLHYYWADQRNHPAIEAAHEHDMGVFIISPTDKGGLLHKSPPKLRRLCAPLHPITFNGLFCLRDERIHTLSCGIARPEEFDELVAAADQLEDAWSVVAPILERLDQEMQNALGRQWVEKWQVGLPNWEDVPGEVNLYHTLRLYNLYKAYDMLEYGKSRYNLLGNGGSWFPGNKVDKMDWFKLAETLSGSPVADRIPDALREAHAAFGAEDRKRLSESE